MNRRAPTSSLNLMALLLVTGLLGCLAHADDELRGVVRVEGEPRGTVEISLPGNADWIPLHKEASLKPGYRVRVGEQSQVALRLSDGNIARLGAGGRATVLPKLEESFGLHLWEGICSFFHRGKPGSSPVQAKGGMAGVEGTEFVMEVRCEDGIESTIVSVVDGLVRFTNTAGMLLLEAGDQAVAEAGVAPRRTAGFIANDLLQWALYYPAVLDLNDLELTTAEESELASSLTAYASGDLLSAVAAYPRGRMPGSHAERVYRAALLLSVGEVESAEHLLDAIETTEDIARNTRLTHALRTLIAAVKFQPRPSSLRPELPTELLAASYHEQSLAQGDKTLESALALATQAAMTSPDFGFAFARVAELQLSFGRRDQANEALRWARSLTPRNAQALAVQGFVFLSENDPLDAIRMFDQAMEIDSGLGNAWLGRGLARFRRGDKQGGREDLLMAAALEPQRAALRSYLAKAYADTGRSEKARDEIRLAKDLDEQDPTAWLYSALINQQHNRVNDAIFDLETSLERNDNRALFRSRQQLDQDKAVRSANLASIYQDAGMEEVAIREAARAVTHDYANSSAHLFMSDSFNERRDPGLLDLRYETVWFNELLLANLLAPPGSARLSQTLGHLDTVRLFESDHSGFATSTAYRSDGRVQQLASEFGTVGDTSWAVDLGYRHHDGMRINNELDSLAAIASIKHQFTPDDSVLVVASYVDYESGDNFQRYEPNNVISSFSFEQRQDPTLLAGYHHQWAPGIHTLLLGGWLNSQATTQYRNEGGGPYEVFQGRGQALLQPQLTAQVQSDVDVYSAEIQQIVQHQRLTVVAGGLLQAGSITTEDSWNQPGGAWPQVDYDLEECFHRVKGYAYATLEVFDQLSLTAGTAYGVMRYPETFATPPASTGATTRESLELKAAMVWSPARPLNIRAMYSRSMAGYGLEQSVRLEPSQLAGFPQAYRNPLPSVGPVPGAELDILGLGVDLKLRSGTYIGIQLDRLSSDDDRLVGLFRSTGVSAASSVTTQQLDYEEKVLSAHLNQLLGKRTVLGVSYRLTDATLDKAYPELTAIAPVGAIRPDSDFHSYLHEIEAVATYNHPMGFFGSVRAGYYQQSNTGNTSSSVLGPAARSEPGDAFAQFDVLLGYRFAGRRAELVFGALNLGDTDYRLSPLTPHAELPRERTYVVRLNLQF